MFDKSRAMSISKSFMDGAIDTQAFYTQLTQTLAEEMNCSRASLWIYPNPDLQDSIECLGLFDRGENAFSAGTVLREDDFGAYFEAMRATGLINAGDARHHPDTSCFNEIYFGPLNIYSLLDVGIRVGGRPYGLFCCENTTDVLMWTDQHVEYLRAVGTLLGFALRKAHA